MGGWNVHHAKISLRVKKRLEQQYGKNPRKWRIPGLSEHCKDAKFCRADELLENTTPSEVAFQRYFTKYWPACRLDPQFVILGYIVDFYIVEHQIAIEIDGAVHLTPEQIIWDNNKDAALKSIGITVFRFRATVNRKRLLGYCNKVFWAITGTEKPILFKAKSKHKKTKKLRATLKKGSSKRRKSALTTAKKRNLVLYKGGNPDKKNRPP